MQVGPREGGRGAPYRGGRGVFDAAAAHKFIVIAG